MAIVRAVSVTVLVALIVIQVVRVVADEGQKVPPVRLTLSVPGSVYASGEKGVVYQGMPIKGEVILQRMDSSEASAPPLVIGGDKWAWYDKVKVLVWRMGSGADAEKSGAASGGSTGPAPDTTSSSVSPAGRTLVKEAQVLKTGSQPVKPELKAGESARCYWKLPSSLSAKLAAGEYVLEAVLDAGQQTDPSVLSGKVTSDEVRITIRVSQDDRARGEVLSSQAEDMAVNGQYDQAVKLYQGALKLNPQNQKLHCSLGRAYDLQGDAENAVKEYRAYVQWVKSSNIPRQGRDDIHDHARVIESEIKRLEAKLQKPTTTP